MLWDLGVLTTGIILLAHGLLMMRHPEYALDLKLGAVCVVIGASIVFYKIVLSKILWEARKRFEKDEEGV